MLYVFCDLVNQILVFQGGLVQGDQLGKRRRSTGLLKPAEVLVPEFNILGFVEQLELAEFFFIQGIDKLRVIDVFKYRL